MEPCNKVNVKDARLSCRVGNYWGNMSARAYGTLLVWRVTAKGTNWTSLFACDCTRKIRHWSPLFTPAYSYSHLLQLIQLIDIMRYVGTTIYYTFLYQGATFFLECYMFSVLYTKYIWHFNIIFSSVCTYVLEYTYINIFVFSLYLFTKKYNILWSIHCILVNYYGTLFYLFIWFELFFILTIFIFWTWCCKRSNFKIYSTSNSKFSIGGYYDSDKLICLNSSL